MARKKAEQVEEQPEVLADEGTNVTEPVEEVVVRAKPFQKKRLRNADIVEKIKALTAEIEKERNIRTTRTEVIERESSFHLDGLIMKLKGLSMSFDVFTRPPKAQ